MGSQQPDSFNMRGAFAVSNSVEDVDIGHQQVGRANQAASTMGTNKHMNPEISSWTGIGIHNEVSRGPLLIPSPQHESVPERKDGNPSHFQNRGNCSGSGNQHSDNHSSSFSLKDHLKFVSGVDNDHQTAIQMKDVNLMSKSKNHYCCQKVKMSGCVAVDILPLLLPNSSLIGFLHVYSLCTCNLLIKFSYY